MIMNLNKVFEIERETGCPILELFYTMEDNKWYVCFEEYITIDGENQKVHLDEAMEQIKKCDNIENFINEVYYDDTRDGDNYFEQISFEWEDNTTSDDIFKTLKDTPYQAETVRFKNEYVILEMEDIYYLTEMIEDHNYSYIYYFYPNKIDELYVKFDEFINILKRINVIRLKR